MQRNVRILTVAIALGTACGDDGSSEGNSGTGSTGSTDSTSTSSTSSTDSTSSTTGTSSSTTTGTSSGSTSSGSTGSTSEGSTGTTGQSFEPGEVVWEREFDTANSDEASDIAWIDGSVFVSGQSNSTSTSDGAMAIWALDPADGEDLWSDEVSSPDNGSSGRSIAVTDTEVAVGGRIGVAQGSSRAHARVYSLTGTLQWTVTPPIDFNGARGVAFHPMGDVYVVSHAGSNTSRLQRTTSPDTVTWTEVLTPSVVVDVAVDGSGNAVVAGSSGTDAWVAKYDPAGDELWSETWPSTSGPSTFINAIAIADDGTIRTTGQVGGPNFDWDVAVHEWNTDTGAIVFGVQHDIGMGTFEEPRGIGIGSSGRTVICGWHDEGTDTATATAWVAEIDDAGAITWQQSMPTRLCNGVAVDDDDFAYLAGISGPNTNQRAWIAKIAP